MTTIRPDATSPTPVGELWDLIADFLHTSTVEAAALSGKLAEAGYLKRPHDVVFTWDELLSIERVFTFADHTEADYRFGLDAIQREVAAHYAAHPDGGSDGDDLVGADPEMPPVVASDVVPPDEVWIVQDDQIVGKITNIAAHPDGGSGNA